MAQWGGHVNIGACPMPDDSPFKNRIVSISFRSTDEWGAYLQDPEIKKVGEHSFLVGKAVDVGGPNNWPVGRVMWVAIHDISQMVEFSSIEEFKSRAQGSPSSKKTRY
jgi:hypothetical protein